MNVIRPNCDMHLRTNFDLLDCTAGGVEGIFISDNENKATATVGNDAVDSLIPPSGGICYVKMTVNIKLNF